MKGINILDSNYLVDERHQHSRFEFSLSADILVFYFSAIRRDIDLKFIQDTYRVILKSLHRSKSQGGYIAF